MGSMSYWLRENIDHSSCRDGAKQAMMFLRICVCKFEGALMLLSRKVPVISASDTLGLQHEEYTCTAQGTMSQRTCCIC